MRFSTKFMWFVVLAVAGLSLVLVKLHGHGQTKNSLRLYWLVPDGLRADPDVFQIYRWAEQGKLPNIKRMMQQGSYGYSIPVFPSHTPVNFASLFTGVLPKRHGVADGPIRIWGYPLKTVARSGFSSLAKTIDPFWYTLEHAGLTVSLLSIPGSTPPELEHGNVVKGRWGGWGTEFPSMIFHTADDGDFRKLLGWNDKVFQAGSPLTQFVAGKVPESWAIPLPKSYSPVREVNLSNSGAELWALLVDTTDDAHENYDTAYFSRDRKSMLFQLKVGDWSPWFNLPLSHKINDMDMHFDQPARLKIIRLGGKDQFRIRLLYDGLNDSLTLPMTLNAKLHEQVGPMVDFVDNFPPQLIYFPEDKATFQEESEMSFAWHAKAQRFFLDQVAQDVFIQSIYSPNQMLTSRWWMGYIDPHSARYNSVGEPERQKLWGEVLAMYQHVDQMVGEALDARSPDGYVVLSSDHGVAPLNYEVRLNNLFARQGWLKFKFDEAAQNLKIDWAHTQVVFLQMNHVFINPAGLAGDYQPAHGPRYEALRQKVIAVLQALKDDKGNSPLSGLHLREEAGQWGLPENRVGDLIVANQSGYGWIEDVTDDGKIFAESLKSGYKQGILPDQEKALWTPFMMVGPGIRSAHKISRPISHLEQYPTIMQALKIVPTYTPDAEALSEIFQ
jgi:predicted AlkP superfamily phosphohydrolase/phosphomutase